MDRIANRPRGFAFLRYATVEESRRAIEGMHGKVTSEGLYANVISFVSLWIPANDSVKLTTKLTPH